MIRRIERPASQPARKLGIAKRKQGLIPVVEDREVPELALRYSNGFVTVEISHDAVDAYVDEFGDVPLPIAIDPETGDRRTYDPRSRVRVVYDREARLREVVTRGRDGVFVRLTVLPGVAGPDGGGDEALGQIAGEEGHDADGDRAPDVVGEEGGQPRGAAGEDDGRPEQDGGESLYVGPRPAFVQ